jgi:hypothetical protein
MAAITAEAVASFQGGTAAARQAAAVALGPHGFAALLAKVRELLLRQVCATRGRLASSTRGAA